MAGSGGSASGAGVSRRRVKRCHLSKLQQLRMCEHLALHPMKRAELAAWAQHEFQLPKAPTLATVTRVLQSFTELKALSPAELLKPAPVFRQRRRARAPTKYPERTRLTKLQQLQLCEHHRANPDAKLGQLAAWAQTEFRLLKEPTKSTVSKILHRYDELRALSANELDRRSARDTRFGELEERVLEYVALQKVLKQPLDGKSILEAAREYADLLGLPADKRPAFTKSWLYKFQTRHGLSLRTGFKKQK